MAEITSEEIEALRETLQPLIGLRINWLSLPHQALTGFEPSQLAVIVNTLLDGILPQIEMLAKDEENLEVLRKIGFKKAPKLLGEREGYPDYIHLSGKRVELKGHFVDNPELNIKRPPTQREPSARLKENITMSVIQPENDALLIAAVRLVEAENWCSPVIVDLGIFSMVECIRARDKRLIDTGGKFINDMPKVMSVKGRLKHMNDEELTNADYEKDTNFGKLKRIPYQPLQDFLAKWS